MRTTRVLLAASLALVACGGDDGDDDAAPPEEATVTIADFAFGPGELTVAAGSTVVFENTDEFAHTAHATDDAFDTGEIAPGTSSAAVTLDEPGTYAYFCGIHNSMRGSITVT